MPPIFGKGILNPDRTPYPGDPRYVLKRNLKQAEDKGYTFYVGPEIEYFYFKNNQVPEPLDEGTYFELIPNDLANNLRNKTVQMLEEMGISIEASHHEVAPSQHEIDPAYSDALSMADNVISATEFPDGGQYYQMIVFGNVHAP